MDSLFHHYSVHLCNSVSTQEICIYAAEYCKLFRSYSKVSSHQFYLPFSPNKNLILALIYKYIRTKTYKDNFIKPEK